MRRPPVSDALQAMAERIVEIGKTRIIVSEAQRRDQVEGVLSEALGQVFAEPFARVTAVVEAAQENVADLFPI